MTRLGGLRGRITALVAAVVILSLAVAFAAVYDGTSSDLRSQLDSDLRGDVDALSAAVASGSKTPEQARQRARAYVTAGRFRPSTQLVFVEVGDRAAVTNEPELLGQTQREPGESEATQRDENTAGAALLHSPQGYSSSAFPDIGSLRVLVDERRIGGELVRFGIGQSLQPVTRAERGVRQAFILAGILALVVAICAAFVMATRTAAPLRRMAATAGLIEEGDLGRRMGGSGRGDEVDALAHAFDEMLDRLQLAFDRQAAFVADASHELRTPLTVIRGQFEVLAMEDTPSVEEVRRVERIVRTEIDRTNRLVDDLLLLAAADDDGFLNRSDVPLRRFLEDLVEGMHAHAPVVRLETAPDVTAHVDPDRLAQAIRNLVTNALTHGPDGGTVTLRALQPAPDRVLIEVDDEGPGIPAANRAAIFDRFHRLTGARTRGVGGAGLGLSIVQAIAEAHGGRVEVGDTAAGGARFTVELPVAG
jgi:signal transduction histidine kinase